MSVYDVTRDDSVTAAKTWVETIREWTQNKTLAGVVMGNKTDLTERRTVPAKMGLDMAASLKMQYLGKLSIRSFLTVTICHLFVIRYEMIHHILNAYLLTIFSRVFSQGQCWS